MYHVPNLNNVNVNTLYTAKTIANLNRKGIKDILSQTGYGSSYIHSNWINFPHKNVFTIIYIKLNLYYYSVIAFL